MPIESSTPATVKAWDPLIRIFHWSLVLSVVIAFISEDDWMNVHIWAGYAIGVLIGIRLLWGLVGTRNARFTSFVRSRRVVMQHLKDMLAFKATHYLGHNPVAAVMVLLLLSSITLVAFSGVIMLAGEGQGPLAHSMFSSWNGEWLEEIHEFLANFTLLLIVAHVSGVIFSSLLEGENLARAMLTGRKKLRAHWEDFDPGPADNNAP
ncbi:cytochrome b/b6 domain-containing protein [Pseudomonadota bacterium]